MSTTDDPIVEAAAFRHASPDTLAPRDRYHPQLVRACRRRGVWAHISTDSVKLTEMNNPQNVLGICKSIKEAVRFVDKLPVLPARADRA